MLKNINDVKAVCWDDVYVLSCVMGQYVFWDDARVVNG